MAKAVKVNNPPALDFPVFDRRIVACTILSAMLSAHNPPSFDGDLVERSFQYADALYSRSAYPQMSFPIPSRIPKGGEVQ